MTSRTDAVDDDKRHKRRDKCCSQGEQKYGYKPLKTYDNSIHNKNSERDMDTNKRDRHELECHFINSLNK